MDWEELLGMLLAFILVVIPVFGITARFALNPMLRTLLELRAASAKQVAGSEQQLAALTAEIQRLSARVEHLEEAGAFERELRRPVLPGATPRS